MTSQRVYAIVKYVKGDICRCDFPDVETARKRCMSMIALDDDDGEIESIKIFRVKGAEAEPVAVYSASSSPKT